MLFFKKVCITDTTYGLSLFLLITSIEDIKKTKFYIGDSVSNSIRDRIPHAVKIENNEFISKNKSFKYLLLLRLKWLFNRLDTIFAQIFAQDHHWFSPQLIGFRKYTLIEDAPFVYSIYNRLPFFKDGILKRFNNNLLNNFIIGPICNGSLGRNKYCKNRIVTETSDINSCLLKNKNYTLINYNEYWKNSSTKKKELIKLIFDINTNTIDVLKTSNIIIFTQPYIFDCGLSEQEMINIYGPYIKKYANDGVLIKPHPRDTLNYHKYFPQTKVLNTKAPMQLLNAIGLKCKIAITVSSSAISSLPTTTKIIWIGNKVNPKIQKVYGNIKCPDKFVLIQDCQGNI